MRRFTLFLSLLVAFVTTTMAQSIDLTFTKVSATDATVAVAGNDIAVDGVTATITANYDWKTLNANSQKFPNASILCPDKNTNAMTAGTGAEGIFTITLNNLPAGYSYKNVTFTSVALNGSGEFQADDANAQPVNFELTAAGEVVGTIENKPIKVNSAGGESVVVNFEVAEAYPATDGSLELKLKLATTESKGCFYGLIKVSIEAVEEEIPALPAFTVTAEAQDPTMGTATVEVVDGVAYFKAVPNEGYKFVDWLFGGEATGQAAEFSFTVEMNMELVAVFEAIEEVGGPNFADGVYEIKNASANGARGYFVYSTEYPTTVQLAGVELSGYESKHYAYGDPKTNSYWYLYTVESTGARYLFNIAEGHFLSKGDFLTNDDSGQSFYASFLSKEIAAPVTIEESTHRAGYYNLKVNGTHYLASSCGWAQNATPVRLSSGQADDGNPLELIPAADVTVDAAVMAAVKAVIDPTAVEPEEPAVKWYRLKETSRNEYMNVVSFDASYEQPAYGMVNIAPYAESNNQIFTMEDAGDGKVYLRTNNNYYLTCGAWNVNVSPDAKEALIFEETTIDGATAYFIHASSQASKGFKIGGVNLGNGTYSDDYYVYCDAPQNLWAYWVLEEATLVEETPEPEQPIDFDWTGTFDVTATVTNAMPDLWSCPETFTLKAEYNSDWELITITEVMGKDIFYLTNGGWLLTVADDKRSAEISFFSFPYGRIEKYDDYGEIVLRNADTSKNTITLTVNNEGVVSVENLSIGYAANEGTNWMWQMELANLSNVTATKGEEAVPTPQYLEVVSVSPVDKAVVNSLDYIQLNFNEEEKASCVATLKPVVLDKDNNIVATLNYGYQNPQGGWLEYYEVGLIFSEPITTPGTYTVKVPAGAIYNNYTKLESQEIVLTYTVEEPQYLEIKSISPENNSTVEVLDYIELTFDEEVFAIGNAELAVMNVLDKDGNVVTDAAISYYDKYNNELPFHMYSITLSKSITAPGTYTINIPEGAIWDTMEGNIPATTLTYTIEGEPEPEPEPEPVTEYAFYEGTNNHDVRALKSFTIADVDTESSMTVENIQVSGGKSPVYVDKTENVFEVKAGSTLYFSEFDWAGEWMHAYAYIDYNNDFIFDTNLNADGTTGGEVVSYNSFNDKTSWGQAVSGGKVNAGDYEGSKGLPHFILPADLAAGDYRMRIKIDWNRLDANFGDAVENNPKTFGGCQCDIVIRIVGDEEPGVDTAIDNVDAEGEQVIYDITGRRIEKINAAGIYIVNGVKVLVK